MILTALYSFESTLDKYFRTLKCSTRNISKRPGKLTKGVLFHQDNAPAHKSVVAMAAVRDCGFELVDHPPYSANLAPSEHFLFPNMKKHLAGKQYWTDDEVISADEDFFLKIRMRASVSLKSKRCNTDGRSVWTARETV